MSKTVGNLGFQLTPSEAKHPSKTALREALGPCLDEEETIHHQLSGSSGLVHDHDGETGTVGNADEVLLVVTDQKLLFAVASEEGDVVEVAYTDLRGIAVEDGLRKSTVTVDVWAGGSYRFKTGESDTLHEAVGYVRQAVDCWQYAETKAENATELLSEFGEHFEDGRLAAARETRQDVLEKLRQARARIDQSDIEAIPALTDRLKDVAEQLHRTGMRARLVRAKTLMTEAKHQTAAGAYTGAYERYWDARDHLENARMLARDHDIEQSSVVEAGLERVETRLETLRVRPLALAKQAKERAEGTERLDTRIEALETAFQHYRDALTAGWGTDYEFAGSKEQIRFQTAVTTSELIEARCALAENHIAAGDDALEAENKQRARRAYEQAADQLEEAQQLSREFRSGDSETITDLIHSLQPRLDTTPA